MYVIFFLFLTKINFNPSFFIFCIYSNYNVKFRLSFHNCSKLLRGIIAILLILGSVVVLSTNTNTQSFSLCDCVYPLLLLLYYSLLKFHDSSCLIFKHSYIQDPIYSPLQMYTIHVWVLVGYLHMYITCMHHKNNIF